MMSHLLLLLFTPWLGHCIHEEVVLELLQPTRDLIYAQDPSSSETKSIVAIAGTGRGSQLGIAVGAYSLQKGI